MAGTNQVKLPLYKKKRRKERIIGLVAVLSLIAAGLLGAMRARADLLPAVQEAVPEAHHVEEIGDDLFRAWGDAEENDLIGYVAISDANGYGGPLEMAVAVSPEGEVIAAVVASHKETPSWMSRMVENDFISSLIGKTYTERFSIGEDVDGITGATYTSRAISEAVREASVDAALFAGLPVEKQAPPKIGFGIPEIALLALFGIGYLGKSPRFKYKKQARWASLITGLVVLGFMYNRPLTLVYINKFLMGYWPQWQTNLYWYFLLGGIFFVFTVDNKNPYCEWFCPFGAAQECLGAIGGAKVRSPGKYRTFLKWAQRGLAWGAILIALLLSNPGVTSYEIFGTMFELIGSNVQFLLLGLVMLTSLFIRRPWCTYLCPLHPVEEFIRMIRKWIIGLWPKRKTNAK